MLLKYIYIKNHKKIKDFELKPLNNNDNELMKRLYKNLNLTVIVGENGMGKTTVLSFVAIVFKNLQRFHNKIPSDFRMVYEIEGRYKKEIVIEKDGRDIYFSINKDKKLLLEFDAKKRKYIDIEKADKCQSVTYDDIKRYLPINVIVSCFDTSYPSDYNWNYVGHRILKINSITASYTDSGFGMDISKGVMRFLIKYFSKTNENLKIFFNSMGFVFSKNLYIYRNFELGAEDKEEIFKNFYKDFKLKSWKEFLQLTTFNNKQDFIKYVFSNSFWHEYIEQTDESIDDKFGYNECFNFEEFIHGSFFNSKLLKRLIENGKFYINEFLIIKNQEELKLNMLSTGEKTFLCRLFFLLSNVQNGSLIILEEPEIHLNYSWVKQIITVISLLFKEYKIHLLISTHSHAFINNLFPENIIILEHWKAQHPDFNTFLANEKEINKQLFKNSSIKNSIEEEMIEIIRHASKQELEDIMDKLGESYFKYMIFKKLNDIGDSNVENNKSNE